MHMGGNQTGMIGMLRRTHPLNPGDYNGLVLLDDPAERQSDVWDSGHLEVDLGSCSGQVEDTADPAQRQRVAIPGMNAPVPEGADPEKWSHRLSDMCPEVYSTRLPAAHQAGYIGICLCIILSNLLTLHAIHQASWSPVLVPGLGNIQLD